jgi:hypothetical protein
MPGESSSFAGETEVDVPNPGAALGDAVSWDIVSAHITAPNIYISLEAHTISIRTASSG